MQNTEKIIGIVMLSVTVLKLPLNKIVYIILFIWLIFCFNSFSLLWNLKGNPLFSKSKFLLLLFFMEILKVIQLQPWLSIYNLLYEIKQQIIFSLFFHKQGLCKAIKRGRCWWRLICFSWCFIKCELLKNIQKKNKLRHLTFIGLVTWA